MPVALARVATTGNRAGATTPTKLPPNMFKTAARKHRTTGMSSLGVCPTHPASNEIVPALTAIETSMPIPPIMMRVDHGTCKSDSFSSPTLISAQTTAKRIAKSETSTREFTQVTAELCGIQRWRIGGTRRMTTKTPMSHTFVR